MGVHTGEQNSQHSEGNFTDNAWHDTNICVNNNTSSLKRVML